MIHTNVKSKKNVHYNESWFIVSDVLSILIAIVATIVGILQYNVILMVFAAVLAGIASFYKIRTNTLKRKFEKEEKESKEVNRLKLQQ